ncbi:MAG TPA: TrkA C-terminal domain-containing protein, partial [Thermomicrobiaceae bacterium]|nr:TrkA C-terminal domain-containing protein [Thermomicrobiaceae bacterium]
VVTRADINRIPAAERPAVRVGGAMTNDPVCADPDMPLDVALDLLATHGVSWMPVIEGRDRSIAGGVSAGGIANAYRRALRSTVHRLRGISEGTVLLEATVSAASQLAGRELRELQLPPETLVVSIRREGVTILPRGNTRIDQGDRLMVMTTVDEEPHVRRYLELEDAAPTLTQPIAGGARRSNQAEPPENP